MGLFDIFKKKASTAAVVEVAEPELPHDPKLGLVADLPMPVADAASYVADLKSAAGDELTWESVETDNTDVAVYRSSFASGVAYQTVYLRCDAAKNPTKLPLGFTK